MDPELRGRLEKVADESIEHFLIDMALVETGEGSVSTDYLLGMLEMTLVSALVGEISKEGIQEMGMRETVECVRPNCDDVFDPILTDGRCPTCQTPHPDALSDKGTIETDTDDREDQIDRAELLGEIRKIVHRREDELRAALNGRRKSELGDDVTQIFDP